MAQNQTPYRSMRVVQDESSKSRLASSMAFWFVYESLGLRETPKQTYGGLEASRAGSRASKNPSGLPSKEGEKEQPHSAGHPHVRNIAIC